MLRPLVHVGYHKTGTTWLQTYLFNATAIGFAAPIAGREVKQRLVAPHPLDFDPQPARDAFFPLMQAASEQSLIPVITNERLSGHPHSGCYDSKDIADRLVQVFPDAQILIVIREQREIILSSYKQYVWGGGPGTLVNYLTGYDRTRIPLFSFEQFKYHRLIEYYHELYGKDDVLVLPYELLDAEPLAFIGSILRFCGQEIPERLDTCFDFSLRINRSLSALDVAVKRHMNFILGRKNELNPHGFSLAPKVSRRLFVRGVRKLNARLPRSINEMLENRLRAKVAEMVRNRYEESNSITSQLIDVDLETYGYAVAHS